MTGAVTENRHKSDCNQKWRLYQYGAPRQNVGQVPARP